MPLDNPDLNGDFAKVSQKEISGRALEDKILDFSASPEEIKEWCFSRDPLMESLSLVANDSEGFKVQGIRTGTEFDRATNRTHLVYKKAAFSLIMNFFDPEMEGMNPDQRSKYLNDYVDFTMNADAQEVERSDRTHRELVELGIIVPSDSSISDQEYRPLIDVQRLTGFFIDNVATLDPLDVNLKDVGKMKELFLVADMLNKASFFGDESAWVVNSLFESRRESGDQARRLYDVIGDIGLDSTDIEMQMLGAKAKWARIAYDLSRSSFYMTDQENGRQKITNKKPIMEMIGILRKITSDKSNPELKKIKGRLHELLWLLDFSAVLLNDKENIDVSVTPSTEFDDAPRIDFPANRRGFDYAVSDRRKKAYILVQLKSNGNPHFEKKYHPMVTELRETDYPYIDRFKLKKKLNALEEYVQTETEESWQAARGFIFGTVFQANDLLIQNQGTYVERMKSSYPRE